MTTDIQHGPSVAGGRLFGLADQLRRKGMDSESAFKDLLLCVSVFVLLRSADIEEGERRAIAEFDGQEYTPELPPDLSWPAILNLDLSNKDSQRVWSGLGSLPPSDLTMPLRRIPVVMDSALNRTPEVLTSARDLVDATWGDASGRGVLASEFEVVLQRLVERARHSGEFATPSALANFMVELAAPRAGDRVYDPCFGLGGLLVGAARRIVGEGMTLSSQDWDQLRSNSIFGIEIQPQIALIATARLILAGMPFPKLEIGNSLERNGAGDHGNEGFDCILANPPFGLRVNEAAASRFRVRSTSADVLFLQHILRSLRQGGRAVVAMPEGFLFRTGAEAKLREILLKEYRVEAVLSLPAGAFAPYAGVKTSLLSVSRLSPMDTVCFVGQAVTSRILADPEAKELRHEVVSIVQSRRAGHSISYEGDELRRVGIRLNGRGIFTLEGGPGADGNPATCALESVERLAKRNWEMSAKDTGEDALETFFERVLNASPGSRVCKLAEVAEVFRGITYNKSSFTDDSKTARQNGIPSSFLETFPPPKKSGIPFVRVQEVTRAEQTRRIGRLPELRRPYAYLTAEGENRVRDHHRLRIGDILITASGTVGRVAIVTEAMAGAIPANSLVVVRVRKDLQAPVLIRLLQSATYQQWFQGQSTGRVIRHLSIQAVRELPVVVFSAQVQQLLSRELSEGVTDERMLELLSQATGQSYWLTLLQSDATLVELDRLSEASDRDRLPEVDRCWKLLDDWLVGSSRWINDAIRDLNHDLVARWLVEWTKNLGELREAREIPRPTTRFAALQSWLQELWGQKFSSSPLKTILTVAERGIAFGSLISQIAGAKDLPGPPSEWPAPYERHRPEVGRLERLSGLPMNLARLEMKGLLEQVRVSFTVQPSVIEVGRQQDLQIRLHNESALAFRNFRVRTVPFESEATSPVLDTDQEITWNLPVTVADPGQLVLHFEWSGQRLDDAPVHGETEISISAVPAGPQMPGLLPLDTSPYVTGGPIGAERPEMFFGRDEILARIKRSLRQEGAGTVLILEGVRRSGKTSILNQLVEVQPPPGWIPVYWSSQSGDGKKRVEGIPAGSLFYGIARECILAAHAKGLSFALPKIGAVSPHVTRVDLAVSLYEHLKPAFSEEGSFELLDVIVEALIAAASPKRILLVLDEFDKIQEGIAAGVTSPQVPENMRYLFHTHAALSGIICGSPEIKRLRDRYWGALFGIGSVIRVTSLDLNSAKRLVTQPAENMLVYAPSAVDLILTLCSRQPYLIQLLCDEIFQRAAQSGDRSITVSSVESAATSDAVAKHDQFRFLWQSVGSDLRRYIVCLIDRLTRADQRVTLDLIVDKLEEEALINDGQLIGAELQELLDFEILCLKEDQLGSSYHVTVPLLSYWMRNNADEQIYREAILNGRTSN